MTIGVRNLVCCVNTAIDSVSCELAALQLSSISADFDLGFGCSVANCAALPDAALNKGRFIYLLDTCGYRFSDGSSWSCNFTSTIAPTLWAWGCNLSGQLGNGTTVSRSSPVSVVGGFTDWCRVDGGRNHSLGIRTNGTVWGWGLNFDGRLGDNSSTDRSSPVSVVGGFTDWCQISAGYIHSLGIRTNGTMWGWGGNGSGSLGDYTSVNRSSPVSVVGGFTDWCQVSTGCRQSLGLRTNGTIWSWGQNDNGRLGDGTTIVRSSPVSVVGGFTDWRQVAAGGSHGLGLRTNGTVWGWGYNNCGQVGDGTSGNNRSSPVSVVGGFTDWCQISAGQRHSLGLRTNGTAWAWGCNSGGQLGNNNTNASNSPVSVVGGFTDWCRVDGGSLHTLGVRTNGTIWAWGSNTIGQLGDGTIVNKSSPVSVVGGFTDWCQIAVGEWHNLVLRSITGFTAV